MGNRRVAAVVAALSLLVACSGPKGIDVEAITAARAAFAAPASALGTAVRAVSVEARSARLEVAAAATDGAALAAARDFALDELADRLDEVAAASVEVELDARVARDGHVALAAQAWSEARLAANRLVASGRAELAWLRQLQQAEQALAEVVALFDEPGSRAQQSERLSAAAVTAQGVADTLATLEEIPGCSRLVEHHDVAAVLVAERARELATYARNGQGNSFDAARAGFRDEPWDVDLVGPQGAEASCWEGGSELVQAADAVEQAIVGLAAALNPGSEVPSSDSTGG